MWVPTDGYIDLLIAATEVSVKKSSLKACWHRQKKRGVHPPCGVSPLCVEKFGLFPAEAVNLGSILQILIRRALSFISGTLLQAEWSVKGAQRVWRWKLSLCLICISDPADRSQMRPQRAPLKLPAGLPHHCQPVSAASSYFLLSTDSQPSPH